MALTVVERDALIGDFACSLFPHLDAETVHRLTSWVLMVDCFDRSDEQIISRWSKISSEFRTPLASGAAARELEAQA